MLNSRLPGKLKMQIAINLASQLNWRKACLRSCSLMDTVFQFCRKKSSGDKGQWWLQNSVNVLLPVLNCTP